MMRILPQFPAFLLISILSTPTLAQTGLGVGEDDVAEWGTGTPEPGGLTTREAFRITRRLCAETNVVGFELVALAPSLDPGYTTVLNSNRLVRECLVGKALRAEGKTSEDYFDPIYINHGQD